MLKLMSAVASSAVIAGVVVYGPQLIATAQADAPQAAQHSADEPTTVAPCAQRGWPYYDAACRKAAGAGQFRPVRPVRLVTTDRL